MAPASAGAAARVELLGVGLLAVALALALALWGHNLNDPSLNNATGGPSANPLGQFGANLADMAKQTIGLASWIVATVLPLWGLRLILGRPLSWPWLPVVALPLALLASAAYLATWPLSEEWPYWVGLGGYVGDFLLHRLERPLGQALYPVVTGLASVVLVILAVGVSWRELWHGARAAAAAPTRLVRSRPAAPEPRWAEAVDRRLGAREARLPAPAKPARAGVLGFIGRLFGDRARPQPSGAPRRPGVLPDPSRPGEPERVVRASPAPARTSVPERRAAALERRRQPGGGRF